MQMSKSITVDSIQRTAQHAGMSTTATKFVDGTWIIYVSPNEQTPSRALMEVALFIEKARDSEKTDMQNAKCTPPTVQNMSTPDTTRSASTMPVLDPPLR